MKARFYHNPRCSKSRQSLELLNERGLDFEIIAYLDQPPSESQLAELIKSLPEDQQGEIVRTNETEYKDRPFELNDFKVVAAKLAKTPKLIQRPILQIGNQARIGRPPEKLLELL